jgi:hypothetical protein
VTCGHRLATAGSLLVDRLVGLGFLGLVHFVVFILVGRQTRSLRHAPGDISCRLP